MNRFIRIRVSGEEIDLTKLLESAKRNAVGDASDCGFEIEHSSRRSLVLSWSEKFSIERKIETGAFSGDSIRETKIITFGFGFKLNSNLFILSDPPLGKERVHKALRILFKKANFIFLQSRVNETCNKSTESFGAKVLAIETEPVLENDGFFVSIKVSGRSDARDQLKKIGPRRLYALRTACIELPLRERRSSIELMVNNSGLIRLSREVDYFECEEIIESIVFDTIEGSANNSP